MMFKTGVILATTATGLLIGAPAAWAACNDDHHRHHNKSWHHDRDDDDNDRGRDYRASKDGDCDGDVNQVNAGSSGGGLINVSNVNLGVPVNVCDNDILSGTLGILAGGLHNNDNHR